MSEKPPVRKMIKDAVEEIGGRATHKQIKNWINEKFNDVNQNTIGAQLNACTVNMPGRVGMPENDHPRENDPRYDFLYSIGRGEVVFYEPKIHGRWTIMQDENGKTTIARDGIPDTNSSSNLEESPLLKFVRDEMQMKSNYQPILIKMLLESKQSKIFTNESSTDEEYFEFLIKTMENTCGQNNWKFFRNRPNLIQIIKDDETFRIAIFQSNSERQSPLDVYLGVSDSAIDFLNDVRPENRFLMIINHAVKNFVLLPYSIEQKYARFVSSSGTGAKKWDATGRKNHAFHITIDKDSASMKTNDNVDENILDCTKFLGSFEQIFGSSEGKTVTTIKQAAIAILQQYKTPLHYKKITKIVLEQKLIKSEGKTPELSLLRDMTEDIRLNKENSIFKKIDEGVYGLRDYNTESSETGESSFAVSYDDIKKKFDELNFDSERFTEGGRNSGSFGSSMDSVKGALEEFVTYDNGATKGGIALKQEQFNHSEIPEILKICGQKIAKWHIDNFVKDGFALWRVKPGREEGGWKYQEEFLSDNSVGVGWNYLGDLSKFQTERELYDYITKVDPKFRSKSSLGAISQKMSKKDLVVVTRASQEIVDFGIITGEYEFQEKDDDSYSHRRRVVWLNQGPVQKSDFPDGHLGTSYQSAHEVKDDKEKMISFLLGEHKPTKYFLLRHAVDGPWKDDLGKKYHIGRKKNGSMGNLVQEIRDAGVGTKTVWWSASGVNAYFWGYGTVSKIETIAEDKDWNLLYDDFKMFEGDTDIQGRMLKKATETVNQHIHDLEDNSKETGFAWRQSINRIPKKLYEEITGDRSGMSDNQESISEEKLDPYIQALRWKPNLILYGPPGTGKTYHATQVAKAITRNQIERLNGEGSKEEYYKTVTFHQTFSYEEFMEGIKAKPTKDKTGVFYDVEDGIFKEFCETAEKDSENKYIIIIDEINRGNIAKIFGELITIIEKDKRERKKITLAYSKKEFSVPENVLIIGTMNTADQSLTHLDAALKRRFTMMEVYPEPDVLKDYKIDGKINLTDLLVAINRKLVDNKFRDGQIGHAYFMSGEDPISKMSELQMVFAYDLIPLLRDYFYDDESKMKGIFGESNWQEWFDEKTGDINEDWQGSDGVKKFRENIRKSFGV